MSFDQEDQWIAGNSPVDPAKLHAIGVVSMSWNLVESMWEQLLWEYLGIAPKTGQLLTRGSGIVTITENQLAAMAEEKDAALVAAVKDCEHFTRACNQSRNHLVHAHVTMRGTLASGRSKKATYESQALPSDLTTIRAVADDLKILRAHLWNIAWYLIERRGGPVRNSSLPGKLPPPTTVVQPNPPSHSKPPRQPRASRR